MIKSSNYLNAVSTARELTAKGITLTARPSSVLGELLDLSASFMQPKTTDLPRILANPNALSNNLLSLSEEERSWQVEAVTGDHVEQSLHSLKIAALAEDIAPMVSAHISHARNVVKPLVNDMAAKLEQFVQVAKPIDPSSCFEIDKRSLPELVTDESFTSDGLEKYEGQSFAFVPVPFSLEAPVADEFYTGLTRLGNDRLNGLVDKWLGRLPPDFIRGLYLVNFTSDTLGLKSLTLPLDRYQVDTSYTALTNPYDRLDRVLGMYLIANRLYLDVQPAQNVSLTQYKEAMRSMIDYCGAEAVKAVRVIRSQAENGVMVTEAIPVKKRVVVNAALYEAFLNNGGCPEALLGMLVSGQVNYIASAVMEQKDTLVRQWQVYAMMTQADVKAEMTLRFRNYALSELAAGLNDLGMTEKDFAQNCNDFKSRVIKEAEKQLDHLSHRLMDDLSHTALHLVAKGRFFYTSAYQLLNEMNEVAKMNPDIDPREAALLSAIHYVADYFETQVIATK